MVHFTVLEELITEKLEEGFQVRIIGKFFNADGSLRFDNFEQTFHSLRQLEFYLNLSQRDSELSNWYFSGELQYKERDQEWTIVKRSQRGQGISSVFTIEEYKGENCYIPSEDMCFIKCYNYLMNHNEEERTTFEDKFKSFLFEERKESRGVMTLARISKFNKVIGSYLQYYKESNKGLYPRYNKSLQNEMVVVKLIDIK